MNSESSPSVSEIGERLDQFLYRWDELRRRPSVIAAAIVVAVAMVGAGWVWTTRTAPPRDRVPIEDRIPVVSLTPTSPPTTEPMRLVVHVAGAVHRPGVYELAAGQRLLDAIAAAGGATPGGQPDRLNLAAPVADGMQIRVPLEGELALMPQAQTDGNTTGPVNLNTATAAQLESLPGVGPATASSIVTYRDEVGGFSSVSDLLGVRGIGDAKLAAIEDLVTVQ